MTPLEQCEAQILACWRGDYGDDKLILYMLGYLNWTWERELIMAEMNDNRRILTFAVGGPLRGYYADLTVRDDENDPGNLIRAWANEHFPKDWASTYRAEDGQSQISTYYLKLLCKGRIEYFNGKTFFHEDTPTGSGRND